MPCSAQATYDHFHNKRDFFALVQYAARVSKVFAASRAPEHYGVHLSDKDSLPKAINMHMDRYDLDSQNLSEVNKDKRAAAMYASRAPQRKDQRCWPPKSCCSLSDTCSTSNSVTSKLFCNMRENVGF